MNILVSFDCFSNSRRKTTLLLFTFTGVCLEQWLNFKMLNIWMKTGFCQTPLIAKNSLFCFYMTDKHTHYAVMFPCQREKNQSTPQCIKKIVTAHIYHSDASRLSAKLIKLFVISGLFYYHLLCLSSAWFSWWAVTVKNGTKRYRNTYHVDDCHLCEGASWQYFCFTPFMGLI